MRDAAHVTPHNFESCIHAIRMFVEASINRGRESVRYSIHKSMHDNNNCIYFVSTVSLSVSQFVSETVDYLISQSIVVDKSGDIWVLLIVLSFCSIS